MNENAQNQPPAPPNVEDDQVNAALNRVDLNVQDAATRAGRANKRLRLASQFHAVEGGITTQEFGEQIAFATRQALMVPAGDNLGNAVLAQAPAWFQEFAQQMNQRFDTIDRRFAQVNQRFDTNDRRFANFEARQRNMMADHAEDTIHPIRRDHDPQLPPNFPTTIAQLRALGDNNATRDFLVF